jgi:hypothetical protein
MPETITISAKNLGALAMPDFCPRCFWVQMHCKELPYQIFPGIFSSIDSYCKRVVHGWFDRNKCAPLWLAGLGDVEGYREPPHYRKFSITDAKAGVVLRGTPDGILAMRDGSFLIIDYKTAKFSAHQDALFPMYATQLNAYAVIGEQRGFRPVSGLALVYTEPVTDDAAAARDRNHSDTGFAMEFTAHIQMVELAPQTIPELLAKVRKIYDCERPPQPRRGCKNCELLQNLIDLASA